MNNIFDNLNILAHLTNDNYLDSDGHKLNILEKETTEYENIHSPSIVNLIINTLLLSLKIKYSNIYKYKLFLEKINIAIDNLYENKHMREIINNDEYFQEILELCDKNNNKLYDQAIQNKCNYYSSIFTLSFNKFLENTIIVCKQIHHVQLSILNSNLFNALSEEEQIDRKKEKNNKTMESEQKTKSKDKKEAEQLSRTHLDAEERSKLILASAPIVGEATDKRP